MNKITSELVKMPERQCNKIQEQNENFEDDEILNELREDIEKKRKEKEKEEKRERRNEEIRRKKEAREAKKNEL